MASVGLSFANDAPTPPDENVRELPAACHELCTGVASVRPRILPYCLLAPGRERLMIRTRALASIGIVLAGAVLFPAATISAENSGSAAAAAAAHRATLEQYCIGCHSGPTPFAGLNLEPLDFDNLEANGAVWEKLLLKLRNREMPPSGRPRPDEATYQAMVNFIESERDRLADLEPNPGRATLHRLNRTEYGNAIRDLLALDIDVADMLPADDIGYGFDNIGDVLNVSPLLLERYLAAASKISRLATGDTALAPSYDTVTLPRGLQQVDRMSEAMPLGSRGGTSVSHFFPVDGIYEISVRLQTVSFKMSQRFSILFRPRPSG